MAYTEEKAGTKGPVLGDVWHLQTYHTCGPLVSVKLVPI